MHDFVAHFETLNESVAHAKTLLETEPCDYEWWHVFDTDSGEIVKASEYQAHGAASFSGDIISDP